MRCQLRGSRVRVNKWRKFDHKTWNGKHENRYIREIVYGKKGLVRYWEIKTEEEKKEEKNGWFVMTKIPFIKCPSSIDWF